MNSTTEYLLDIYRQSDHDQASAGQLTQYLHELNCELNSHATQIPNPSIAGHLKIEILRLCHVSLCCNHQCQHQIALNTLERALQLSNILVNIDQQQGCYCTVIILGLMGEIYHIQRYHLFALASFHAALEAYETLTAPDLKAQDHMATIRCTIASITEITNHPDVAMEYYLDALWYLTASDQQPQPKQIIKQLNRLCNMLQPASVKAA